MFKKVFCRFFALSISVLTVFGCVYNVFAENAADSAVYKSSEFFSINNAENSWDDGKWVAQTYDPVSDSYKNMKNKTASKAGRSEDGSSEYAVYYGVNVWNSPNVNGWWMAPACVATVSDVKHSAVKTFVAPKDGRVVVSFGNKFFAKQNPNEARIVHSTNSKSGQIWPEEGYFIVNVDNTEIPDDIVLYVSKGDRIRFEIRIPGGEMNGKNYYSKTYWDPAVKYLSPRTESSVTKFQSGEYKLDISALDIIEESIVIGAGYDSNGNLADVKYFENSSASVLLQGDISSVKVMVWNSISEMSPITSVETISYDGFKLQENVKVYYNNEEISYTNEPYYYGNKLLLPFGETIEAFGCDVEYNEALGKYQSLINGVEISVTEGSPYAEYDLIPFEMAYSSNDNNSVIYVNAELFDKIYGFTANLEDNKFHISGELVQKGSDAVGEYLDSVTDKTAVLNSNSLLSAGVSNSSLLSKQTVEISDLSDYNTGIEITNLTEPEVYYNSQIKMPVKSSVAAGDMLVMDFWAKMISTDDESGLATFNTVFETIEGNNRKYINKTDTVSDEWTYFRYIFKVTDEISASGAQVGFRVGFKPQKIQLAGFNLINYGSKLDVSKLGDEFSQTAEYRGIEDDALWREEALKRIEKHRVRDINVKVTDKDGNPVNSVEVFADMTKSEFMWGTAVNPETLLGNTEAAQWYRKTLVENFNSAVMEVGMKTGTFDMDKMNNTANFIMNNDMYFRGHAVLWDNANYFPDVDLTTLTEEEAFNYLLRHASRIIYGVGSAIDELDAINEPLHNKYLQEKFGKQFATRLLKAISDMIAEVNPDIDIFVNEGLCAVNSQWNDFRQTVSLIEKYRELGGRVDGIGLQNHLTEANYPQEFYKQLDYLSKYVDKLAITEYDFDSGYIDSSKKSETVEAKHLRDMMITAYSHPSVTGFTMWGFTDDGHWRKNAPLYNADHTAKTEALGYWNEYVKNQWFTHTSAKISQNREVSMRGHRGEYVITVKSGDATADITLNVTDNGENTVCAVIDNGTITLTSSDEVVKNIEQDYILNNAMTKEEAENAYIKQ